MDQIPVNTTLLEQLGLVRSDQWPTIERRARRNARGLPLLESFWIDAMLQLGYVTPYQAKLLQEGKSDLLQVGTNVILNRRESLGWADCFDAYRIDDHRPVHLAILQNLPQDQWEPVSKQLIELHASTDHNEDEKLFLPIREVGIDDRRGVWITSPPCRGESAARWMVQHGRLSPDVVLEIARQMAQGLSRLESRQQTHGDLRASTLFFDREQGIRLFLPGVRAIVRPRESFAETSGPIDMYDGLSPERAAEGTPPEVKSDLFAAGSLWWQMLVGRAPMPGGDGKAKLRAATQRKVEDIRTHAVDVPEPLVQAIAACTARSQEDRPESFDQLAKMLGKPNPKGAQAVRRLIRRNRDTALPIVSDAPLSRQTRYLSIAIVATSILIAIVALGLAADRFLNPPVQKVVVLPKPAELPKPVKQEVKPENPITIQPTPIQPSDPPSATPALDETTIVLETDKPISAESLTSRLQPGIKKVISQKGHRAQIVIHENPLRITIPHVRFEGIDFVASKPETDLDTASDTHRAMLELRDSAATFVGCTFRSHHDEQSLPQTVVHWIFPETGLDTKKNQATLHNGRIVFEDCLFGNETGTALHAEVHAAVAVELRNVLHLGGGPMLFLETPPKRDEPWRIQAENVTLRQSGPFWACRYQSTIAGRVRIEASDSVLAPKGKQPLLLFVGENDPTPIFRKIEWIGRGTLFKKTNPTAVWQDNSGNREVMSDLNASIEGLARSQIEFANPANHTPSASVLRTWDAPLTSETPPGIDAKRLPQ